MMLKDPSLLRDQCLVAGRWISSDTHIVVNNPATGQKVGLVPRLGPQETQLAIEAAAQAWPAWRARTADLAGQGVPLQMVTIAPQSHPVPLHLSCILPLHRSCILLLHRPCILPDLVRAGALACLFLQ